MTIMPKNFDCDMSGNRLGGPTEKGQPHVTPRDDKNSQIAKRLILPIHCEAND
jgi:hypothetical protein